MVVTRFDPVYLGVGAVAILVGVLHYRLSQRAAWAGAIVPVLCAGLTGWLLATGRIPGFVELVALILGFAALAAYWRQARNVARTTLVGDAWKRGQPLMLHGWIYGLADGRLQDLQISIKDGAELQPTVELAIAGVRARYAPC